MSTTNSYTSLMSTEGCGSFEESGVDSLSNFGTETEYDTLSEMAASATSNSTDQSAFRLDADSSSQDARNAFDFDQIMLDLDLDNKRKGEASMQMTLKETPKQEQEVNEHQNLLQTTAKILEDRNMELLQTNKRLLAIAKGLGLGPFLEEHKELLSLSADNTKMEF